MEFTVSEGQKNTRRPPTWVFSGYVAFLYACMVLVDDEDCLSKSIVRGVRSKARVPLVRIPKKIGWTIPRRNLSKARCMVTEDF